MELQSEQLLEVIVELSGAGTREDVARIAVGKGTAALGALSGALWVLNADESELEMMGVAEQVLGSDVARWRTIRLADDLPICRAARTGEPIFLESLDEYRAHFPASHARIAPVFANTEAAFALLPLGAGDATPGALSLVYTGTRAFDPSERTFLALFARQLGLSLERVHLAEIERESRRLTEIARARSELLYRLTAACNRLDDIQAICGLAMATVERATESDRAAILLYDDLEALDTAAPTGTMRFIASNRLSDTYRRAVEGHSPWPRDAIDPVPIVADVSDPAWSEYRDVFRAEGVATLAFVPILGRLVGTDRGTLAEVASLSHTPLLGKFMLYRDRSRAFTSDQLRFVQTVGVHVAQAIERARNQRELARAYREEREARLRADESARARDEILSVVSHDLRNPLSTIMMGASALLQPESAGEHVPAVAERVLRDAQRMSRLIEDLVDIAAIQTGRLAISRERHEPARLVAHARDVFGPLAARRGLALQAMAADGLASITCDGDRALQIFSNLVSNALEVTPAGGAIALGVTPRDDEVVFFVKDTGPGIAPDDVPHLFERFWRGGHSTYKGSGLGLAIVRGLVEAHGGRVWVESEVGAGSTFYFALTPPRSN